MVGRHIVLLLVHVFRSLVSQRAALHKARQPQHQQSLLNKRIAAHKTLLFALARAAPTVLSTNQVILQDVEVQLTLSCKVLARMTEIVQTMLRSAGESFVHFWPDIPYQQGFTSST